MVYSLFLVEDEALELEFLKEHINWSDMNIQVIGTARNGRRAYEQIQSLLPDIVLTDVRMPIMDGLRLASLIRAQFDWMKVVFLSGHDEFTYVKSAIESGAMGYLLKPVNPQELADIMDKVKEDVERTRLLYRSKQLLADKHAETVVLARDESLRKQALQELAALNPSFANSKFVSGIIQTDGRETLNIPAPEEMNRWIREEMKAVGAEGITVHTGNGGWFVAVRKDSRSDIEALWCRLIEKGRSAWGIPFTIGICDQERLLSDAPAMLNTAKRAIEERFYLGCGRVIRSSEIRNPSETGHGNEMHLRFFGKINPEQLTEALGSIDPYFEFLAATRYPKSKLMNRFAASFHQLSAELSKYDDWETRGIGRSEEWLQSVESQETLEGVKVYVSDLLSAICEYLADKQKDRVEKIVQKVAELIETQYMKPLTVEYLAGQVYLSPNYLRWLFKTKKGCTIHEYLTGVRLRKALELLRDPSLKIKDVARKTGYDNTSYFCSVFYKTQGVTPNEYRKKYL